MALVKLPNLKIKHELRVLSDHAPLICYQEATQVYKSQFKYLSMWESHPDFRPLVSSAWGVNAYGSALYILQCKLRATKTAIKEWNTHTFGKLQSRIATARGELEDLELQGQL